MGFTLSEKVMIPFAKASLSGRMDRKIFTYRLSRARRCSENALVIIVTRLQIFRALMEYDPQDIKVIILATYALHNWLRTNIVGRAIYSPPQYVDNKNVVMGAEQGGGGCLM